MGACRVCDHDLSPFMSLGRMPIANGFLDPERVASEYFYEMLPSVCERCGMFQLHDVPDPAAQFHDGYAYHTSSSEPLRAHFSAAAACIRDRWLVGSVDPLVVEIGSNDGTFLRYIRETGVRHVGIEPSANVARIAADAGLRIENAGFDAATASRIEASDGLADVIYAANVLGHVASFRSIAEGVCRLLKPAGVLVFETVYLGDIWRDCTFDQLYHAFGFSVASVSRAFGEYGLQLIDVEPLRIEGGSMRYFVARRGAYPDSPAVTRHLDQEAAVGLARTSTWSAWARRCSQKRADLIELIDRCHESGGSVAGYGATAKSTALLNYCGLGPERVAFIQDTTPAKIGKKSPGMHIPVVSRAHFLENPPAYTINFAWNYRAFIEKKEADYARSGGSWIYHVPTVHHT